MQIEVIKEQHNALLDRKELQIKIKHPAATPARIEVKNKVAADLKVEPDRVIVDNMKTAFGKKETIAYIKVYESTEVASQIEKEHILKRNRPSTTEPAGEGRDGGSAGGGKDGTSWRGGRDGDYGTSWRGGRDGDYGTSWRGGRDGDYGTSWRGGRDGDYGTSWRGGRDGDYGTSWRGGRDGDYGTSWRGGRDADCGTS